MAPSNAQRGGTDDDGSSPPPDQDENDVGSHVVLLGVETQPTPPTATVLLDLCNLPPAATSSERHRRLAMMRSFLKSRPTEEMTIRQLLTSRDCRDKKTGCMPLHWAAGTGFDEMVMLLLDHRTDEQQHRQRQQQRHDVIPVSADQRAYHPSTDRTPLHYAARNGHLTTCRLLIERYHANPHPQCGRGSVTPLQLAVWQNRLEIVRYLVEWDACRPTSISSSAASSCGGGGGGKKRNGAHVVHERNGFNCGLMHWIGLVPRKRWGGQESVVPPADDEGSSSSSEHGNDNDDVDDGSGVLPLARYLHSLGISYDSTPGNANAQGHTPMHKAAWGGNVPLLRYYRDEHGVYDDVQDDAGNYCADIAKMRDNRDAHRWLLEHGSADRADSYRILGLAVGSSDEEVRRRYVELARMHHPDKQHRLLVEDGEDGASASASASSVDEFIRIKRAYEHLTKEGGVGRQKNPKFDELKLLEDHRRISGGGGGGNKDGEGMRDADDDDDDDLFLARLLAVLSDYGDDGFPVSLLARRWNQIWPDRPFPRPDEYVIERRARRHTGGKDGEQEAKVVQKKVKLLKFLKWKCRDSQVHFRNIEGDVLAFDRSFATRSSSASNSLTQ